MRRRRSSSRCSRNDICPPSCRPSSSPPLSVSRRVEAIIEFKFQVQSSKSGRKLLTLNLELETSLRSVHLVFLFAVGAPGRLGRGGLVGPSGRGVARPRLAAASVLG